MIEGEGSHSCCSKMEGEQPDVVPVVDVNVNRDGDRELTYEQCCAMFDEDEK